MLAESLKLSSLITMYLTTKFRICLFAVLLISLPSINTLTANSHKIGALVAYEQRVQDLMAQMTLTEKIGQMCQYVGLNYLSASSAEMTAEEVLNSDSQAAYKEFKIKDIAQMVVDAKIGSFLHVLTAEEANKLQALAQQSRLGIPLLIGIDAIHGNAMVNGSTVYPSPISIAATFSDSLAYQIGRETALEMRATGSHWAFSPNLDVLRDPRWGRVGETFGEDPYLVGSLGKNMIQGYQLDDFTGTNKVIACAKHLVAGSEPSNGLNFSSMDLSDRSLREIYLKPFKDAVDAGVFTIMAAHNEVNGIPAHMHKQIMTEIVRDEFGFGGFYVSDWLDIERLELLHYVVDNFKDGVELSVDAGMDMHMHGPYFLEAVRDLVDQGKLAESRVDFACAKILEAKFRLGLFEDPFVDLDQINEKIFTPEHQATALRAARESIVLLKNDGVLPFDNGQGKRILVTGPNANNHSTLGDWAMQQPVDQVTTIFEGIRTLGTKRGYHVDWHDSNQRIAKMSSADIQETVQAAKGYDSVVLVVGDNSMRYEWMQRTAGENLARADINLAGRQLDLVKQLHATGIPVTVVYVSGKPLCEPWIVDNIKAVIAAWEPGSFGGQAVAEIIFGEVNPSGKTPLTMPRSVGQLRMVYNHKPSQYFKEYAFEQTSPLFPFGFGLSYSDFDYTKLGVDVLDYSLEAPIIRVSVQIQNLSEIAGTEVVQVYFRDRVSSVTRPVKELVDYRRVSLQAGQAKQVVFEIPIERLAFYDINMERCVEPGEFEFMVGGSSADDDLLKQTIQVKRHHSY